MDNTSRSRDSWQIACSWRGYSKAPLAAAGVEEIDDVVMLRVLASTTHNNVPQHRDGIGRIMCAVS